MANAKLITASASTGQTCYAIVRRDSDGYLLEASSGVFDTGLTATQAGNLLTEDSLIKGLYETTEDREVWANGAYTYIAYVEASSGTINPVTDTLIGIERVYFAQDIELSNKEQYAMTSSIGTFVSGMRKENTDNFGLIGKGISAITSIVRDIQNILAKRR
jgi:hypothetical protein